MFTPKAATALLATIALTTMVSAAPVEVEGDYASPPTQFDPNDVNGNGVLDLVEALQYEHPPTLHQYLLDNKDHWPQSEPQPNYYAKREAEADANADANFDKLIPYSPPSFGKVIPYQPPTFGKLPPVIQPPQPNIIPFPFPFTPQPQPGPCSGNNNVASCCAPGSVGCSVVPGNTVNGLLSLGLGLNALNQACSANQNINCCQQSNNGNLLALNTCGPLLQL